MNVRLALLFSLAWLAATGCRRDPYMDTYLESLNSEKRYLEDIIYDLQYEYKAKAEELESLREENQRLRGGGQDDDSPQIQFPSDGSPSIDLGDPSKSLPDIEPSPLPSPAPDDGASDSGPTDQRVTHVILNPYLSSGHNFDGMPGDDGVTLVIQPRNADDRLVAVAGAVSIVLLDPLIDGDAARVARWDFDEAEIQLRLRGANAREGGIHLKLPWTDKPPLHGQLHVFVRYTSDDDRKLETEGSLTVALPGQFSNRWTPRPVDAPGQLPPEVAVRPDGSSAAPFSSASIPSVLTDNVIPGSLTEIAAPVDPKPSARASQASRRPTWQPFR